MKKNQHPAQTPDPLLSDQIGRCLKKTGPCPKAANGVHRWLWKAARVLRQCPEEIACAAISQAVAGCGRPVPEAEVRNAIQNARRPGPAKATRAWPAKNAELIRDVVNNQAGSKVLSVLSPIRPEEITPDALLDRLFPGPAGDVLLCVGENQRHATTMTKAALAGTVAVHQFIVPNPMTSKVGTTQAGRPSQRSLANTGPRRFLVVESDPIKWANLTAREQAESETEAKYIAAKKGEAIAALLHLAEKAPEFPLVVVVDSGGKSLHGWFLVAGAEETVMLKFFRYAVALGADPATWTRCQFVRMPGGTRDNGKQQRVLYFNPEPLEGK